MCLLETASLLLEQMKDGRLLNHKTPKEMKIGYHFIYYLSFLVFTALGHVSAQDPHRFDPPWNTPPSSAVEFTIRGINNVPDLYGDIVDPQLVVFFAGNQFMCIDDLLAGFKKKHPHIERIF